MQSSSIEVDRLPVGLSSRKREVLLLLKRESEMSLADLATALRISKMGALKHMNALEATGLAQRSFRANGRGRPRVYFRLATAASNLFPRAYAQITLSALSFVEQNLGRKAVERALEQRTQDVYTRHRGKFEGKDLRERAETLAQIRDEEGYMAELGTRRKDTVELLEYNCPIIAVAEKYGEACSVERELFQKLLRANVDVTHRVVAGAPVCRFMIRRRMSESKGSR